jgi:hypothetical protein
MKKTRRAILLGLVLVALLLMTLWLSGTFCSNDRRPTKILAFNPKGCFLPCVMNIVPGEDSFTESSETVASLVPDSQKVNAQEFWVEGEGENMEIYITLKAEDPRAGDFVKLIELRFHGTGQLTTLGTLLDAGYEPDRVFRSRASGPQSIGLIITFKNQPQVIAVVAGIDRIENQSPIREIFVIAKQSQYVLNDIITLRHFEDEITWIGFASVEEYWQQLPK